MRRTDWRVRVSSWLVGVAVATVAWAQPLQDELDGLIEDSQLARKLPISVSIIDLADGTELASYKPTAPMIPASNMKLLTSGAAVSVLGPEFAFVTELRLVDTPGGAAVVIEGSGDPALADPDLLDQMDLGVEDLLELWTDAVAGAHSGPIAAVIADDRVFDRELTHPTWPRAQLNRRYCCQVSGLNFHGNVLAIYTKPGSVGRPPILTLRPEAPWISVTNKAKSVGKGKQHTAWAARAYQRNEISVHGDVRFATTPIEVTLHDNALHTARLIAARLGARGMAEPGARLAAGTEDLSGGRPLHSVRTTIATALDRCNKDSENLYAEALIKRVGHEVAQAPGSWSNGAAVVRMELNERLGSGAGAQIIVADGSGMSRENRVTTELLARWVRSLTLDPRVGDMFVASLPLAGAEGTLRKRFRKEAPTRQVRAKTGYLSGVSAMTGVVPGREAGEGVVFSIISNEKPNSVPLKNVRALEEAIVIMLDEWIASPAASRYGG